MTAKTLSTSEPETKIEGRKTLHSQMRRISNANLKVFEAYIETGLALYAIEEYELYLEDKEDECKNFREFVQKKKDAGTWSFDLKQATRCINNAVTWKYLDDNLPEGAERPRSQKAMQVLQPYSKQEAFDAWSTFIVVAERTGLPITGDALEEWIRHGMREIETSVSSPAPQLTEKSEPPDHYESAPSPKHARKSIEDEHVGIISNSDLDLWGRYEDEKFVKIGRLIFSPARLPVISASKVVDGVARSLKDGTLGQDLVYAAILNADAFHVDFTDLGWRVKAEPIK